MLLKRYKDGLYGVEAEKRIKKLVLKKHIILLSFRKNSILYLLGKTLVILIFFVPSILIRFMFVLIETVTENVVNFSFDLMDLDNDFIALLLMPLTLFFIVLPIIAFPIYYLIRALYNFILFFGVIFDYKEHRIINDEINSLEHKCLGCGVPISRRPRNHRFCYSCWKLWSLKHTRHRLREKYTKSEDSI